MVNKKEIREFEKLKKERIKDEESAIDWKIIISIWIIFVIIVVFILEYVFKFNYYPYRILTATILFIVIFVYFKLKNETKPKILSKK